MLQITQPDLIAWALGECVLTDHSAVGSPLLVYVPTTQPFLHCVASPFHSFVTTYYAAMHGVCVRDGTSREGNLPVTVCGMATETASQLLHVSE